MTYFADDLVTLHHGDCIAVLRELPDNSVDAVVTDPPYGLSEVRPERLAEALRRWCTGDREFIPSGTGGFMGKSWDNFVPPPAVWDECARVLKPGGHLLAFAGSRTIDLMALSIRLAGFEIRDSIAWLYGSGFPKSMDVSKAIDKARDDDQDVRRVTEWLAEQRDSAGITNRQIDEHFGFAGMAGHWTARPHVKIAQVPQWEQWIRLQELIGFDDSMHAEVERLNERKGEWGNERPDRDVSGPGQNTVLSPTQSVRDSGTPATEAAQRWAGWGTALKPAFEPIVVGRKPLAGTVAANVQEHGTGALNIDACRVGDDERTNPAGGASSLQRESRVRHGYRENVTESVGEESTVSGRWPTNVLLDDHQAAELDKQSGVLTSGLMPPGTPKQGKSAGILGEFKPQESTSATYGDTGGASRFFPVFRYQAKAPTAERPNVDGVQHPTVKPLDLMRWLVRLVTPPGAIVLEPFAGSGTTAEACVLEDRRCIAIEREADYLPLIVSRLRKPQQQGLFDLGDAS